MPELVMRGAERGERVIATAGAARVQVMSLGARELLRPNVLTDTARLRAHEAPVLEIHHADGLRRGMEHQSFTSCTILRAFPLNMGHGGGVASFR